MSEQIDTTSNGATATNPSRAHSRKAGKKGSKHKAKAAGKASAAKTVATKTVATKTRSGKKIRRAKAGGRGEMAKKGSFALVAHIPRDLHAKAWRKVRKLQKRDPSLSMSAWVESVIAKAAK